MKPVDLERRALLNSSLRWALLAGAASLAACTTVTEMLAPRTVEISKAELLSKIGQQFPMRNTVLDLFDVTCATPRLTLQPDANRVLADPGYPQRHAIEHIERGTMLASGKSGAELLDFIDANGLTFGRWVRQAPYSVRCGVVAKLPQALRMAQLPLAEQYAAVELFRGTMARHSVIAYRSDSPAALRAIAFSGDAWPAYVPIRMADTICLQERLPAGAAAVLINQTHTNTDLIVPIDAAEKRMFDATDGKCSIGEIARGIATSSRNESPLDLARHFFERLWWYDQVVFDSSRQMERK